jgi:hypothetical protein
MEVSSTSMNVASSTENAISHGLCFGRHEAWFGAAGSAMVSEL